MLRVVTILALYLNVAAEAVRLGVWLADRAPQGCGEPAPEDGRLRVVWVDQASFRRAFEDGDPGAGSVRLVPWGSDGLPRGIRIYGIRPGSIFARLGLEDGDVVLSVEGVPLVAPESALAAYEMLKTRGHASLVLERRGRVMEILVLRE